MENTTNINDLPDDIKEKIMEARGAVSLMEIVQSAVANIPIFDRRISVNVDNAVAISGVVDDELTKQWVQNSLAQVQGVSQIINSINVYPCERMVEMHVNGKRHQASSLKELEAIFVGHRQFEYVNYDLFDSNGKELNLRMNKTHSSAMVYDNPQKLTLGVTNRPAAQANEAQYLMDDAGKPVAHPGWELVDNRDGFDIMRCFLLTGKLWGGVQWK